MKKHSDNHSATPIHVSNYIDILQDITKQIKASQQQAFMAINLALNMRNWMIGKIITEKQAQHAWGSEFLQKLAQDLANLHPGNQGFSIANIYRIKAFYAAYQNITTAVIILEHLPIFHIPWGQNVLILIKIKDQDEALWYAQQSKEQGWSRSTLEVQIKKDLYHRQGKIISNFSTTLSEPRSTITQQTFKDPYIFDFLTLEDNHIERDLELGLIAQVEKLILELGKGFALYGRQYHLEVDNEDYYIDLLFYHTKLKCYIVVELKARNFNPKDVGQLNFYLSAVDDLVADKNDNPTIGLLLCKTKKKFTAEYALRGVNRPIGIAEYATELIEKLEKEFEKNLPTITEIEAELEKIELLENLKKNQS